MTIFLHELRQSRISIIIWTVSIAFMMGICVLIYPQMGDRMDEIGAVFAQMGGFSQAFGMDRLNFGEFLGFFSIECGNMLGLGGAFFAALCGISALSKEERDAYSRIFTDSSDIESACCNRKAACRGHRSTYTQCSHNRGDCRDNAGGGGDS